MKFIFFISILLSVKQCYTQELSNNIVPLLTLKVSDKKPPSDYGYSTDQPLLTGSFLDLNTLLINSIKFYNTFTWPNGQKLDFSKRGTAQSPKGGILDCYTLVSPDKDTLKLYVDPYNKGEIFQPEGLRKAEAKSFSQLVLPFIKMIEEINAVEDLLIDSTGKEKQARVMIFIQNSVGMDYLYNEEVIKNLSADKTISMDLLTILFRSYLFNTFLAYAKGINNEKAFGLEKMRSAYQKVIKLHPETRNKGLMDWLRIK